MAANYPNPSTTVLFLIDLINHFEFSWEEELLVPSVAHLR